MKSSPPAPRRAGLLALGALLAAFLSASTTASADTVEDTGHWWMFMLEGPIGGAPQAPASFRWWLDIQPRFLEDVSGLQQGLLRPGVGYVLGERTTVWLGYARIRTASESGPTSHENRIWQQFWWKPRIGDVALQSRTRLEQRFLDTGARTGWRFRQFVKASWNLQPQSRYSLVGYEEVFVDLNDTDFGQSTGFSQNRLFAGLGMGLDGGGRARLEVGYLNQFSSGTTIDTMNHLLSINLFLNF